MTAKQITNAKRIPTTDELDAARATMADVTPGGQRLTDDQIAAQALLAQCGPDCKCGECGSAPFAITLPADDPDAPHATIGYVARTDYPEGQWVAMFPDLNDNLHDPQPVKGWGRTVGSFEIAEAQVRANYSRWLSSRTRVYRGYSEYLRQR